jgi:hypothetical protein
MIMPTSRRNTMRLELHSYKMLLALLSLRLVVVVPLLVTCQAPTHLAGVGDGLRGTNTCFSVVDHPLMCF